MRKLPLIPALKTAVKWRRTHVDRLEKPLPVSVAVQMSLHRSKETLFNSDIIKRNKMATVVWEGSVKLMIIVGRKLYLQNAVEFEEKSITQTQKLHSSNATEYPYFFPSNRYTAKYCCVDCCIKIWIVSLLKNYILPTAKSLRTGNSPKICKNELLPSGAISRRYEGTGYFDFSILGHVFAVTEMRCKDADCTPLLCTKFCLGTVARTKLLKSRAWFLQDRLLCPRVWIEDEPAT